jgi:hypothetical protein
MPVTETPRQRLPAGLVYAIAATAGVLVAISELFIAIVLGAALL